MKGNEMQIIEKLIEQYGWAIQIYIIVGIVLFAIAAVVIAAVGYNAVKILRKDSTEMEKQHEEFEKRAAEKRKRFEERRKQFDERWDDFHKK